MIKKLFVAILLIVGLLVGLAFALPFYFKDDIRKAIDEAIAAKVDATVYFDENKIDITLFKSFPDLSLTLADFGVIGKGVFQGDTLVNVASFRLDIDLMSVIKGEEIAIKGLILNNPQLLIKVTKDGKANYLIAKPDSTQQSTESSPSTTKLKISNWQINNGQMLYLDSSLTAYVTVVNLNHMGKGDFSQGIFDMMTHTSIDSMTVYYGNMLCMSKARAEAELIMNMDMNNMIFTFKENLLKVNELPVTFAGTFKMPQEGMDFDFTFEAKENTFKSLLSLVPSIYKKDFSSLKTNGTFAFNGAYKGTFSSERNLMPGYKVALLVKDGYFQYPSLPAAVSEIGMDMLVENPTGQTPDLVVDVKHFHLKPADFPIDGRAKIIGNDAYDVDIKAKIDMAAVEKFYPIEKIDLKGLIEGEMMAQGRVSEPDKTKVNASGYVSVQNFEASGELMPKPFKITSAKALITTAAIVLESFDGFAGKSDLNLNGKLSNYMGFALKNEILNGELNYKGQLLDVNEWMPKPSTTNTTATISSTNGTADTTSKMAVIPIPKTLNMAFVANVGKVLYDNMTLENMIGKMTIKEGILRMENLNFNTLGGSIGMNGAYNTANPAQPKFDFVLDMRALDISQSFKTFNTVQKLAPIAQNMVGNYSTKFAIRGDLGQDMMPVYQSLLGGGDIAVRGAAIQNLTALNRVSEVTRISELKDPKLSDIVAHAEVKDGKIHFAPFDVKLGNFKTTVAGYTAVDGGINYDLKLDVSSSQYAQMLGAKTMNAKVGGTFKDPKVSTQIGEAYKEQAKEAIKEVKGVVKEEGKKLVDEGKKQAKDVITGIITGKKDSTANKKPVQDQLKDAGKNAGDKVKDIFKKF